MVLRPPAVESLAFFSRRPSPRRLAPPQPRYPTPSTISSRKDLKGLFCSANSFCSADSRQQTADSSQQTTDSRKQTTIKDQCSAAQHSTVQTNIAQCRIVPSSADKCRTAEPTPGVQWSQGSVDYRVWTGRVECGLSPSPTPGNQPPSCPATPPHHPCNTEPASICFVFLFVTFCIKLARW